MPLPRFIRALQFNIEDPFGYYTEYVTADRLLEIAERVRANTLIVFARDAWGRVFYEGSRLYPRHARAALDVVELTRKARERGISVIVMAAHTANRYIYRKHPGWAQRTREGEVVILEHIPLEERVKDPHWPLICPNSPAMEEYFEPEVREAIEKTGADALLLDSWRYLPDISRACYCKYCRAKFRRETGHELPEHFDPDDEAYRLAWEWRYKVNVETLARLAKAVKSVKSDALILFNNHPGGWAGRESRVAQQAREYLDGVFAEGTEADSKGPGFLTLITKISRAVSSDGKVVLTTRNLFHFLRTPQSPPGATIKQGIREIVAAGGHPVATMFSSQLFSDPRALDALAEVYSELEEVEDLIAGAEPVRYAAVVYSTLTQDWGMHPRPEYHIGEIEGFAWMMMHSHTPWEVIDDATLEDPAKLGRYKVVVAPAVSVLSDRAEEALREYLMGGGILVATHQFGYMRDDFTYRHSLALEDLLGSRFEGVLKLGYFYVDVASGEGPSRELWRGLPDSIPFGDYSTAFKRDRRDPMLGELVKVSLARPSDGEQWILARVRLAWRRWGYEYTLGRSTPPPGALTEMPGIIVTRTGQAKTVYYPHRLGLHYNRLGHPDYMELFLRPLRLVAPRPPVEVEAPDTVQAEPYRNGEAIIVHLVNHTYNQRFLDAPIGAARQPLPPFDPVYSIHPIRNVIRVPQVTIRASVEDGDYIVRVHPQGIEERVRASGGLLEYRLRDLGEYALVEIQPAR